MGTARPRPDTCGRTPGFRNAARRRRASGHGRPQGMFEDLGLKCLGPIPGHDRDAVEQALRRAKGYPGPVLVHVLTQKGAAIRLPNKMRPTASMASG